MGPLSNKHNRGAPAAPLNSILGFKQYFRVGNRRRRQQPDGDEGADTPGVARAPEALATAIPGVARFIVTLSAQADVFGVGITAVVGSMLVPASWVMSG